MSQIAEIRGCRVIGVAGGPEKCAWLTDTLHLDGATDYKNEDVSARLSTHCPDGLDVFWDNVGGELLDIALAHLAMKARVVICGAIASYNTHQLPPGPSNYFQLLVKRARMEGFLVLDYLPQIHDAMTELLPWAQDGRIQYREDIRDGLEHAPAALLSLFEGTHYGKLMVKISDPGVPPRSDTELVAAMRLAAR